MSNVKEFISSKYDGKWVGDSRNTFAKMIGGDIVYTQRGTDIHGKPFEVSYSGPGFLLEVSPLSANTNFNARKRLEFRPHPVRENGSLEELLYGIVSSHRTEVEALGVAIITEVSPNGRGRVKTLWGDDAAKALDKLAYPDLADDLSISQEAYRDD
jgi:hypothetical protein